MTPEVRVCSECGKRANWEWLKTVMQAGTWGRRCDHETCQYLDNWQPAEPDPIKERAAISNMKYYTENPSELEHLQEAQAQADVPAWRSSLT